MTLEDFFTLTEMKDGLTVPSRVHELLAVMQKEKDCAVNNIGDAPRQWAAVCSTIAATENRDCLDLFIQLDGLWFVDRWLKEAVSNSSGTSDGFIEESITALLRAIEKLQVNKTRSISSGIWASVNNLIHHSSSRVQDRARALSDSWNDSCESRHDSQIVQGGDVVGLVSGDFETAKNILAKGSDDDDKRCTAEPSSIRDTPSRSLNCPEPERDQNVELLTGVDDGSCGDGAVASSLAQNGLGTAPESDVINNSSNFCDKGSSIASASTKLVSGINSTSDAANLQETKLDPGLQKNSADKSPSVSVSDGDETAVAAPEVSSGDEKGSKTMPMLEDTEPNEGDEELGDSYDFSKSSSFSTNRKKPDFELEYGIVDALEVARQVAQEVEREVEDYREPSASSSEKINEEQPGSQDSISGKETDTETGEFRAEDLASSDNQAVQDEVMPVRDSNPNIELESAQVPEKGFCGFDLNEEVSADDADNPAVDLVSAPVSVVSASRPAAASASASPAAPLHFKGTLGWKGSAATSAFRPASPRTVPEGNNSIETGATSNSGKRRQDWLDIDLNLSENGGGGGDEKGVGLMLGRQPATLPFFQRGESSSLNACTGKSERANLDLNLASDEAASTSRKEDGIFFLRNGHRRSPSPATSSSSLRNFDLNDRPLFSHHDASSSSQSFNLYGGSRQGVDPVISIMGAKVEVGTRTNGKPLDPAFDTNMARIGVMGMIPTVPYAHPPVFGYNGYNGYATAPSMYGPGGPVPYMVDSRGAPLLPQYSQPPFMMNMGVGPVGLNGAGPSRTHFDLNSGYPVEGGSNVPGLSLRQFFVTNQQQQQQQQQQPRSFEEHLRATPQASSSSSGKRKEPEGGWEPYSLHYKQPHQQQQQHQQPPWR
ncbi:hypothetical protein LINGRAHAP2_LOCUS28106 [Linum grandiflorum]